MFVIFWQLLCYNARFQYLIHLLSLQWSRGFRMLS